MKRSFLLLVFFIFVFIQLIGNVFQQIKNESYYLQVTEMPDIKDALRKLVENLDKATFTPIREGWAFDYGFKDGWILNKYEYIRSLLDYKDIQSMFSYSIFLSGPHTNEKLDLNSKYSFGHYNQKFVTDLHQSINFILNDKTFIKATKPLLEKYDILIFLKKHKDIYNITQKYPDDFESIKIKYINGLQDKTWTEGAYRNEVPEFLNSNDYWNWSETSYHFWIRRDIDSTKNIWISLINDVLRAYDFNE